MKGLKLLIRLAVSAVLIIWAFSKIDFDLLGQSLTQTNYLYLLPCLPLFWLQYSLRALRWDYLLRPIKKIPYRSLIASTVVGFTANLVLPFRLGELVRAVDLGRREKISEVSTLGTILVERALDSLIILTFFLAAALALGFLDPGSEWSIRVRAGVFGFIIIYLIAVGVMTTLALKPDPSLAFFRFIFRFLPGRAYGLVMDTLIALVDGLKTLRQPRLLLAAVVYTLGLWAIQPLPLYFLAVAVGHPVSFTAAVFVMGINCLAIAAPSAPGFIGVMHAAIVFGFANLLGIPKEQALAVAIIYHGGNYLFTIIYCLKFVVRGQVSILELGQAVRGQESS